METDSIVIIPTYNEKENIENILRVVFGLEKAFHVLIIDDGSPDGTADIVKRLQREFPGRLHLVERSGKQGLGTAYICGFKWAIEHGYDFIFEMDADFSHNPQDLLRLYAACTEHGAGALGAGVNQRFNALKSRIVLQILLVWLVTIPACFVLGVLAMVALQSIH